MAVTSASMQQTKTVAQPLRQYHAYDVLTGTGNGVPIIIPESCRCGVTFISSGSTGCFDITTDSEDMINAGTARWTAAQADATANFYKEYFCISGVRLRSTSGAVYLSVCAKTV